MGDSGAESNAWTQLGLLANREGNYAQGARYFERAREIASSAGEGGTMKRASCYIGIARGNMEVGGRA